MTGPRGDKKIADRKKSSTRMMFVINSVQLYSECLTKEALDGLGDFNIGGQIIQTVKYADDLVLMAKEEMVLQA